MACLLTTRKQQNIALMKENIMKTKRTHRPTGINRQGNSISLLFFHFIAILLVLSQFPSKATNVYCHLTAIAYKIRTVVEREERTK